MIAAGPGAVFRAAFRGEWRAIAIVSALTLGTFLYHLVIFLRERKTRPVPEDRWVVPSAEEVARVIKSKPGGPKGEQSDPASR